MGRRFESCRAHQINLCAVNSLCGCRSLRHFLSVGNMTRNMTTENLQHLFCVRVHVGHGHTQSLPSHDLAERPRIHVGCDASGEGVPERVKHEPANPGCCQCALVLLLERAVIDVAAFGGGREYVAYLWRLDGTPAVLEHTAHLARQ